MIRTFIVALAAGIVVTLAVLGTRRLTETPVIVPLLEQDPAGSTIERWHVEAGDRLAATGAGTTPVPASIAPLAEPELVALGVETLKVRDAGGEVIGVASRISAPERAGGPKAVWWTFVVGTRGTLAAWVPDAAMPANGRLIGGTRTFEGVQGRFSEQSLADGAWQIEIVQENQGR